MLEGATRQMEAEGNIHVAFGNMARSTITTFELALIRWRKGDSPVSDLNAVVDWAERMIAAVSKWSPEEHTLVGYGLTWDIAQYAGILLDRELFVPSAIMDVVRPGRSENADVALGYELLDALHGVPLRQPVEELLARLAIKKRQALAVDTYQTYFAIIGGGEHGTEIDVLVRRAETNYARRARDPFYTGGLGFDGGGPDNPYVVDFVLAAILKKIRWGGETIHKWRW